MSDVTTAPVSPAPVSPALGADVDAVPGHYWSWRGQSIYYVHAGPDQAGPDQAGPGQAEPGQAGQPQGDRPPLLLIHGFGASTDHWRKNIADLQQDFSVWAIDLLGFGRSAKPAWIYSGELWRDQLHDFITEVIGRPAILAGNSLGGYAALCVAAQRPSSAQGLILLNSAGPFSDVPQAPPNPLRQAIGKVTRAIVLQPWISYWVFQNARRRSTIRKTLQRVYLDPSAVTDRLVEDIYRPSCDPGAAQVFAAVFKSPQGETVDALLHQLSVPLLMLWGEGDPWMNVRDRAARFRQHYPALREQFLHAGHCPHDEVPALVDQAIRTWVADQIVSH